MRAGRGRYVLGTVDDHTRAVARLGGVLCLTSAALRRGWAVKTVPERPHLMFSRGRRLDPTDRSVVTHRGDLRACDVEDGVTTAEVTLTHCLRRLPFDEALCGADSALRAGIGPSVLRRIAEEARGPGSLQMRRVVEFASAEKANPFESSLHAIAGWVVLRFAHEHVMREPGYVREVLLAAVALAERMREVGLLAPPTA